jgi:hypothetical protein
MESEAAKRLAEATWLTVVVSPCMVETHGELRLGPDLIERSRHIAGRLARLERRGAPDPRLAGAGVRRPSARPGRPAHTLLTSGAHTPGRPSTPLR